MIDWTLDIPTVSEANNTDHWTVKSKRKKLQKTLLQLRWQKEKPNVPLPCKVKLTRLAPRKLDSDNLVYCFKHIRDVIADLIRPGLSPGQADSCDLIKWDYSQESAPGRSIRIEISF